MKSKIFLVTGGLGFIGKHFCRRCLELGHFVTNVDMVNYASDRFVSKEFMGFSTYRHIQEDIVNLKYLPESDYIVNFAAESHVDNSIADNRQFCHSNFMGVQRLLELTRAKGKNDSPRFIQISTDEVYGDLLTGKHVEQDVLRPSNPYSSTKAAADMLILGWARTYHITYNILRMSNNYGPHQYPEKLIPKSCWRIKRGLPALMHGDGSYKRSWLHVEDSVDAILAVIERGEKNCIYNVQGDTELENIEVLRRISHILGVKEEEGFLSVPNRVGQDVRYSLDDDRLRSLGWAPTRNFDESLEKILSEIDFQRFI
jgi:dTDP-glucose 4,6-dehydratase